MRRVQPPEGALKRQYVRCPSGSRPEPYFVAIGMPREVIYREGLRAEEMRYRHRDIAVAPHKCSFWERFDIHILAKEAREAFLAKVKQVRPDLPQNKEAGQELLKAWAWLERVFAKKGVRL